MRLGDRKKGCKQRASTVIGILARETICNKLEHFFGAAHFHTNECIHAPMLAGWRVHGLIAHSQWKLASTTSQNGILAGGTPRSTLGLRWFLRLVTVNHNPYRCMIFVNLLKQVDRCFGMSYYPLKQDARLQVYGVRDGSLRIHASEHRPTSGRGRGVRDAEADARRLCHDAGLCH